MSRFLLYFSRVFDFWALAGAIEVLTQGGQVHRMLSQGGKKRSPKDNGRRISEMNCLCNIFEDSKFLWLVIFALFLLSCNDGCGCGGYNGGCGNGCGCDNSRCC